jgi:hypothetical protein
MNTIKQSSSQLEAQWQTRVIGLWPAIKGSLAKVHKPCIRPHCPACARGDKHPAWLLAFTQGGRRRCMYVPLDLVRWVRQAITNGRRLEQLLYQTGPSLIKEYRSRQKDPADSLPKNRAKR